MGPPDGCGEPLPEHVGQRWRDKTGVDILDGIGSTEMLHIFISNRPDRIRHGTLGQPVPGFDVKIVDGDGNPVAAGETGELLVRDVEAEIALERGVLTLPTVRLAVFQLAILVSITVVNDVC